MRKCGIHTLPRNRLIFIPTEFKVFSSAQPFAFKFQLPSSLKGFDFDEKLNGLLTSFSDLHVARPKYREIKMQKECSFQ